MTNRIERFIGRLLHRGGSDQGSPLCFYDILHRRWIHLPLGQHVSLVGSTGAGKSNLIADLLLNLRPEVDSGTALIYGIDLKNGIELSRFDSYLADLATDMDETLNMLEQLSRLMDERGEQLRFEHRTSTTMDTRTPMILIVIDEAAELVGAMDKQGKAKQERIRTLLDRILRLGRATGFTVIMASQDPRKEALPLRDRCPMRIALRLNSKEEAIMLLGETAVKAGAAPWLIGVRQAGTGYLYDRDRHQVIRFRSQRIPDRAVQGIRDSHTRIDPMHDEKHKPNGPYGENPTPAAR